MDTQLLHDDLCEDLSCGPAAAAAVCSKPAIAAQPSLQHRMGQLPLLDDDCDADSPCPTSRSIANECN